MSEPTATPALPAAVRQRVVAIAADALGRLPADQVPPALLQVARFTPARRAKAGAVALAAALETDAPFRQRVGSRLREVSPELVDAVEAGSRPAAADPAEVAAAAYLLRPTGWGDVLAEVAVDLKAGAESARVAQLEEALARLDEQVRRARADAQAAVAEARETVTKARTELADARRRNRELETELGRLRSAATADATAARQALADASASGSAAGAEARRLRTRVTELEAAVEAARRATRGERGHDDIRLRLLLDTLLGAAQGLRNELALPPAQAAGELPADRVAELAGASAAAAPGVADVATRALAFDDPARLDQLLALPRVHLVVDGYNVTKSGYGTLALEQQRARLLQGLGALAARTRAEVTCVFDGASVAAPAVQAPRGVRVLFSPAGQTADELIDQVVRAEPAGRPVVVVSSDQEVAGRALDAGARAVPSVALLRRLDRA